MRNTIRRTALCLAALAAAACSSDPEQPTITTAFSALRGAIGGAEPQPLSDAQIRQALGSVQTPIKFVEIESRGGQALMGPVQTNGAYRTFASSTGQAVVFRNGFAVQSRGLGGDLMSSDEDALLALIRNRQQGTAPYVMRYLSGDNDTITYAYTCNVLPQGPRGYAAGVVRANGTALEVHCVSETGPDFVSTYLVDGSGEVLEARQWFGGLTEYLTYRTLRR